ncbi:MAG: hypothetical protein WAV07_11205 [Candidatus Contendobacter sp.]
MILPPHALAARLFSVKREFSKTELLEQIGVRAGAHEHDQARLPAVIELVQEQEIAADANVSAACALICWSTRT